MQSETATHKDSIFAQLKARTALQHRQTETVAGLMRDDFSPEDYKNLLKRFYAFYKSYDEKLRSSLEKKSVGFYEVKNFNTPRLLADLKSLGVSDEDISEIESFEDLPALDSTEKIFGSLYVVEGSTLGGQIISRHLKEKFGFDESNGAAFFFGYGKNTGKMWNAFREAMTEFAERNDIDREEIVLSANETFEKIGKCLSGNAVNPLV